jgi:hypothetical protein
MAETMGNFILVVSASVNKKEKKRKEEQKTVSLVLSFALSVLLA